MVCGHCVLTFSLTINETLQWLSSLPILMHESFWWRQCSDRYIISLSPHLHTPPPPTHTHTHPFSPSLIFPWTLSTMCNYLHLRVGPTPFFQPSKMWRKTVQEALTGFPRSLGDSSEPVPSTSFEPVDNRPPTQEGKQTSQESASASERQL